MTDASKTLRLADGRNLGYLRFGAPEGAAFFYFHGMPGSRHESLLLQHQATALNLSIIALDRPGYGLSDICHEHSLLNWPRDVAAVADMLGLERFGIIGVSGGGPYALACAYALAERLTGVALVCGLGPVFNSALLKDMPFFFRTAFSLEQISPGLFRLFYGLPLQNLARMNPRLAVRLLARHLGGPDRKVLLREDVLDNIATNLSQAFYQGIDGATDDVHLYQQPWGFELADITAEIQLWHGAADPIVPVSHSKFITEQLTNATLKLVPGAGHFSLFILHAESILSGLVAPAKTFKSVV